MSMRIYVSTDAHRHMKHMILFGQHACYLVPFVNPQIDSPSVSSLKINRI